MSNEHFGLEELDVWKKAREFKQAVRTIAKQFPAEEKFRLTDQIIRSSRPLIHS